MDNIKGKRILLDPLGGLYFDESTKSWRHQKKMVGNVSADIITSEIAAVVHDLLRTVGADVFSTRCLRRSRAEVGESGQPLFSECAGQYLRHCRIRPSLRADKLNEHLPSTVWSGGATALERDASSRVAFGRYVSASLVLAIDVSNYASDEGLEIRHNGVGQAREVADYMLREMSKRTRRKPKSPTKLLDEEKSYGELSVPALVVNCGSAWDPQTARLLQAQWFRTSLALGAFAGVWRALVQDQSDDSARSAPLRPLLPQRVENGIVTP
jgi:hypothetical protein